MSSALFFVFPSHGSIFNYFFSILKFIDFIYLEEHSVDYDEHEQVTAV